MRLHVTSGARDDDDVMPGSVCGDYRIIACRVCIACCGLDWKLNPNILDAAEQWYQHDVYLLAANLEHVDCITGQRAATAPTGGTALGAIAVPSVVVAAAPGQQHQPCICLCWCASESASAA